MSRSVLLRSSHFTSLLLCSEPMCLTEPLCAAIASCRPHLLCCCNVQSRPSLRKGANRETATSRSTLLAGAVLERDWSFNFARLQSESLTNCSNAVFSQCFRIQRTNCNCKQNNAIVRLSRASLSKSLTCRSQRAGQGAVPVAWMSCRAGWARLGRGSLPFSFP